MLIWLSSSPSGLRPLHAVTVTIEQCLVLSVTAAAAAAGCDVTIRMMSYRCAVGRVDSVGVVDGIILMADTISEQQISHESHDTAQYE